VDPKSVNPILENKGSAKLKQKVKLKTILLRPHIQICDLKKINELANFLKKEQLCSESIEQAEIKIKYGGYLNKEQESAKKLKKLENIKIPKEFEFEKLHSISTEGRQKLKMIEPSTIGQASRISGVSPSDINVLLVYLGR
jgi:tRNA uridine 5-carboxymethylaminomethyl modification enzyme